MINSTSIELIHDSRRELVSLVHDTKKLSQPILILVSMDKTLSDNEEADLISEYNLQDLIAEVRVPF